MSRAHAAGTAEPVVSTLSPEQARDLPLDHWLRPGSSVSCAQDLPLLVGDAARSHRVIVTVNRRPVSHAAMLTHTYRFLDGGELRVGIIGAVATDPAHRSRGYGRQCLETLQRQALEDGHHLVVLWDETGSGWYERFGFRRAGQEMLHLCVREDVTGALRQGWVRPMEHRDVPAVARLHRRGRAFVKRGDDDWRRLLTIPRMTGWVLERQQTVEAYGFVGKGNDLEGCLHEWGGAGLTLPILVAGVFDACPHLKDLVVMSPPWQHEARRAMEAHGTVAHDGVLGMIWTPDADRLAKQLSLVELEGHDDQTVLDAVLHGDEAVPFYLAGLDSM